jgi:hypothetical protein
MSVFVIILIALGGLLFLAGLSYALWRIEQSEYRALQKRQEDAWLNHSFWNIINSINWNDDRDDWR